MRYPRRLWEMYRLEPEATLHWPALPRPGRWRAISGALATTGSLVVFFGLLHSLPILLAAGLLLIAGAWIAHRSSHNRTGRAIAVRQRVRDETGCQVIGLARHAGGIPYMKTYLRPSPPVVLGLSQTHLTVFLNDPLRTYVTIPLADVVQVFTGNPSPQEVSWDEDSLDPSPGLSEALLNVVARLGSRKTYRLVFHEFEAGTSAEFWRARIVRAGLPATGEGP